MFTLTGICRLLIFTLILPFNFWECTLYTHTHSFVHTCMYYIIFIDPKTHNFLHYILSDILMPLIIGGGLYLLVDMLLLFSLPVVSHCFWPHRLQHTRPPYPSPTPGVCPSSCSLHLWCHPVISSSDALFSFCPLSFSASGTFPMSHLFTSDAQNTVASASTLVLLVNI